MRKIYAFTNTFAIESNRLHQYNNASPSYQLPSYMVTRKLNLSEKISGISIKHFSIPGNFVMVTRYREGNIVCHCQNFELPTD